MYYLVSYQNPSRKPLKSDGTLRPPALPSHATTELKGMCRGITLRTGCRGIKVAGYMNPRKYHSVYVWFLTALVFLAGGAGTRTRVRLDTWKAEAGRWSVLGQPRQ